jgi:hypothetical protein
LRFDFLYVGAVPFLEYFAISIFRLCLKGKSVKFIIIQVFRSN